MNDGTPTARQQLRRMAEGCHDTLSAFAPYRMAHGGYWACHSQSGWYLIDAYRYEHLISASDRGEIIDVEDNSDPYQICGTRLCTVILATVTVAAGYLLVTP